MFLQRFFYLIFSFFSTLLYAEEIAKTYDVKSGVITYDLYGGGLIAPDINLSIKGTQTLYFRGWGEERLEQVERTEVVTGSIYSVEKHKSIKKILDSTLYSVDFSTQRIMQSNTLSEDKGKIDLTLMKRSGVMNISSFDCDLWESESRKICLHKGIVLLDEKRHLGFLYGKRVKVFDENRTLLDNDFVLPDYPIKNDLLMRDKIKTTQTSKYKTLSDKIINAKKDVSLQGKTNTARVNEFAQSLFEKEQKFLPMLLQTLRETRVCLYSAKNQIDANICLNEIVELKASFNEDEENTVFIWIDETRQNILDEFDEGIRQLEIQMPCINRAQNITDLSKCMK